MLILSRRVGEVLVVGDSLVKIRVLEIKGNQVRMGIEAPKTIPVNREEIYLAKVADKTIKYNPIA